MQLYEYKVVPAPARGEKAKGIKSTDARFAHALTRLLNSLAADGWEYLRAETLPCEERTGLTRSLTVTQQNLLIFRRALETEDAPYAEEEAFGTLHHTAEPAPLSIQTAPAPVPPLRPIGGAAAGPTPSFRAIPSAPEAPRRITPLGSPTDRD
jgi:hypothetical protein